MLYSVRITLTHTNPWQARARVCGINKRNNAIKTKLEVTGHQGI